ncbi:MAG: PrsW family glutamic-type intramembrane protease [Bacteroidia bacterium]
MRKTLYLSAFLLSSIPLFGRESYGAWVNYSQSVMSATILLVIVMVGGMALRWTFNNRYRPSGGKDSFLRFAWKNALVRLTRFVLGVVLVVNTMVPDPYDDKSWHDVAEFAKFRRMKGLAEEAYRELSDRYPAIVNYHAEYLAAHYGEEEWASKSGEVDIDVDAEQPILRYSKLGMEADAFSKNLSRLGLGIAEYYERSPNLALTQFRAITDSRMTYRHLFMGRIFEGRNMLDSAEHHYRLEISLKQQAPKAIEELGTMLYFGMPDSLQRIAAFVEDPKVADHVPLLLKRYLYTKEAKFGPYLQVMVADWWANIQWIGLIGALLGTGLWMLFLRQLDANSKEPWLPMMATFVGGGAFSFLALVMYDFVHFELGFKMNGSPGHDFLYCVFSIGLIEEIVKIIPFLLVMQFTRRIDNPVKYILYASVSALGFAFVENLMYFDRSGVSIMHGRILITVVFHMFATSTVAFGMMLGKYRFRKLQWALFPAFLLLACIAHGFYDFWIINESVGALMFLTYGLFIYATFQYAGYINNALNQLRVFKGRVMLDPSKVATFLTVGLVSILLFEYLCLSLVYSAKVGNYSLLQSMGMGSFLMFFVVLNLSNIDVVQGEWFWIKLWNFATRVHYNRALGQRLLLKAKSRDSILAPLLPMIGEVIARVSLNGDNRYFLFQFDNAPQINGHPLEYVLLRAKRDGEVPEPRSSVEAMVVAFRDKEALIRTDKQRRDFKVLDTVMID